MLIKKIIFLAFINKNNLAIWRKMITLRVGFQEGGDSHIRWRVCTKKRATHHEPHVPTKTIYIMMKALHISVKAYFYLAAHIHNISIWYAIFVA